MYTFILTSQVELGFDLNYNSLPAKWRGRQARNFTANVPKILDLKSCSKQIFRKLTLGAPGFADLSCHLVYLLCRRDQVKPRVGS